MADLVIRYLVCGIYLLGAACSRVTSVGEPNVYAIEKMKKNLVVVQSNYQVGALLEWNTKKGRELYRNPIHSDALARVSVDGKKILIVGRLGADSLQVVDRQTGAIESQISLGRYSNPQDVVSLADGGILFTAFESNWIHVLDSQKNKEVLDLGRFADGDGFAELSRMGMQDGKIWIQALRLNRREQFTPNGDSKILIMKDQRLEREITLPYSNPVTDFKSGPDGHFYLGCAGKIGVKTQLDGAIVRIDTRTFEVETVIREKDLGGDIVDFEMFSPQNGVAVVANPASRLVRFNGESVSLVEGRADYSLLGLTLDRETSFLFLADANPKEPSVRVWDLEMVEQKEHKIPLQLPPVQILLAP